jgi:hypothetical protein
MCFGGGGSDAGAEAAARARREERERQERIRQARRQIDAIFEGGTIGLSPIGPEAEFNPQQTYYDAQGNPLGLEPVTRQVTVTGQTPDPHAIVAGRAPGPNALPQNQPQTRTVTEAPPRFNRLRNQRDIFTGQPREVEGSFGPDYYSGYREDYLDYYQPQLDERRTEANEDITYQLARQGILESSGARERYGDLQEEYGERAAELQNQADTAVAEKRSDVEQARTSLYNLAQSSADPQLAASQAQARASTLDSPQQFSPLGNVFASLVNSGANVARAERAGYPGLNTGLFRQPLTGSSSSVRVRG